MREKRRALPTELALLVLLAGLRGVRWSILAIIFGIHATTHSAHFTRMCKFVASEYRHLLNVRHQAKRTFDKGRVNDMTQAVAEIVLHTHDGELAEHFRGVNMIVDGTRPCRRHSRGSGLGEGGGGGRRGAGAAAGGTFFIVQGEENTFLAGER